MGVSADLGYVHGHANPFQRLIQRFGSTAVGAWLFSKVLVRMDLACNKITGGRTSVPQLLAGLPVVFVKTTGRRSGRPRTTPLVAMPIGDTLALLGTNFGRPATPGWVLNLDADPAARVRYRDTALDLMARRATEGERTEVWNVAAIVAPTYLAYKERVTGRDIRIFVLEHIR